MKSMFNVSEAEYDAWNDEDIDWADRMWKQEEYEVFDAPADSVDAVTSVCGGE